MYGILFLLLVEWLILLARYPEDLKALIFLHFLGICDIIILLVSPLTFIIYFSHLWFLYRRNLHLVLSAKCFFYAYFSSIHLLPLLSSLQPLLLLLFLLILLSFLHSSLISSATSNQLSVSTHNHHNLESIYYSYQVNLYTHL